MGNINIVGKWDLNNNKWKIPNKKEYGKSFAYGIYDRIINDKNNDEINYIIIANGTRLEQHSKDSKKINDKELKIDYVINHLKKQSENFQIISLFMDSDAPIIEEAKLFSSFIDSLAIDENTKSINIIGVSKCGTMSFYVPKFFKHYESYDKTSIHNIAVPYQGTKFASPFVIFNEIKVFLNAKLGKNEISKKSYLYLLKLYRSICSNSHMDYDISLPGGVPIEHQYRYDRNFIKNIFSKENIESVKRLHLFKNYTTEIDKSTFLDALLALNFNGMGLCLCDEFFFHSKSDGLTSLNSQKSVENALNITSSHLKSMHHDVTSIPKVYDVILSEIESSIKDLKSRNKVRKIV